MIKGQVVLIYLGHKVSVTSAFQTSCGQRERNPILNARLARYNNPAVANAVINVWTIQQWLNGYNMVGSHEKLPLSQEQDAERRKVLQGSVNSSS